MNEDQLAEEVKADNYIQERLDSLHEIDCKVVSILDSLSNLFQVYSNPLGQDQVKESFVKQTQNIYNTLSTVAIDFRKEIRLMDENIGVYNKNKDGLMILPISVDQKNTTLGSRKLNDQLSELSEILAKDDKQDEKISKIDTSMDEIIQPSFDVKEEVMESSGIENVDTKMEDDDDIFENIV